MDMKSVVEVTFIPFISGFIPTVFKRSIFDMPVNWRS
jgi:hypothetical protein